MFGLKSKKKVRDSDRLQEILGSYELPVFSSSAMQILAMLRDPDSELEDIAQAICANPGVMVKVLKTVNSAAFGARQAVTSIQHAASLMGRARLESTVLGVAVGNALPQSKSPHFDPGRFWRACYRRAVAAERFARLLHPSQACEAFTVGLLQDLAIPVLAEAHAAEYGPILQYCLFDPKRQESLADLEVERLSFTHSEAGRLLTAEWGLPEALCAAIGDHHGPAGEDTLPATRLVALIRKNDDRPGVDEVVECARAEFDLESDLVVALIEEAFAQADDLAAMMRT